VERILPKKVDHDLQRETFALAAMRLIARDGLDGLTMRAVAAEAGLSYGSLFHYFNSKEELLIHAVRYSTSSQTQRVNEYSTQFSGLKALEALLCDDAIVDQSSRDTWLVWITFVYKAAHDPRFTEMNAELIEGWVERFRQHLLDARDAGEIAEDIDVEEEAMAVWAFSAGIGQTGLLHPQWMSVARQKQVIANYLERMRSPA
jgi:AcrR family transcriptional regulator